MARTKQIEAWISIGRVNSDGETIGHQELMVKGEFTPAARGSRGHYGEAMEPDEPEQMEFLEASDDDGGEVELSKEEEAEAIQALWNAVERED